ncbi:hypothetical protein AB6D11_06080 [Vibrio splendidus]
MVTRLLQHKSGDLGVTIDYHQTVENQIICVEWTVITIKPVDLSSCPLSWLTYCYPQIKNLVGAIFKPTPFVETLLGSATFNAPIKIATGRGLSQCDVVSALEELINQDHSVSHFVLTDSDNIMKFSGLSSFDFYGQLQVMGLCTKYEGSILGRSEDIFFKWDEHC